MKFYGFCYLGIKFSGNILMNTCQKMSMCGTQTFIKNVLDLTIICQMFECSKPECSRSWSLQGNQNPSTVCLSPGPSQRQEHSSFKVYIFRVDLLINNPRLWLCSGAGNLEPLPLSNTNPGILDHSSVNSAPGQHELDKC